MRKRWWMLILLLAMIGLLAFKMMGQGKEEATLSGDPRKSSSGTAAASHATQGSREEEAEAEKERKKPAPRPEIKKRPKEEPAPTAVAVAGMQGFVTSPFNGKMVDVRNIPPGTLVSDPTFPASEKKLFRVPPDENSAEGAEGK